LRTDHRILITMFLILGVMVGTNLLFPPIEPDPTQVVTGELGDSASLADNTNPDQADTGSGVEGVETDAVPTLPGTSPDVQADVPAETAVGESFTVETPLYRARLSTRGAVIESLEVLGFESAAREGPVELVLETAPLLGNRIILRADTLDTRALVFATGPGGARDVTVRASGGNEQVTFRYEHPTQSFAFEVEYTFAPDNYVIGVTGRVSGIGDAVLLTDMGDGIPINERPQDDRQVFGFVSKNSRSGIEARRLAKVEAFALVEGPLDWVAFKSKYFLTAAVAATDGAPERLFGGAVIGERIAEDQLSAAFAQAFDGDGGFSYRMYLGPQVRSQLVAVGAELENVNPYGWAFMRPIIRPFTGVITKFLIWMHENFNLAYGWVLMVFGILMRVVMFPLYQKTMRAQMKNMAVQPRLKEIQTKYKDKPEQLQKEMMKLYKEEGFNPLAGCLPMLLPWPVLVALFFVFQNTIELRGVPFGWLPDLAAPDPFYILPLFLGVSMFLLQFISIRSIPDANPQMKMMMWIFPVVFMVMFANFASGLNLYYATANVAMLPQQYWIAQERKRATAKNASKAEADETESADSKDDEPGDGKDTESAPSAGPSSPEGSGSSRSAKKRKRRRGRP